MLWVDRRAQLSAWINSLVTKPGAAFFKNERVSSFIFRRAYRLGHTFYAVLDLVWEGPAKSGIFAPPVQPDTLQISEVWTTRFLFWTANLPSAWKVWLRSVRQSWRNRRWRTSDANRSQGGEKLANVFSGMVWPIFMGFSPSGTEFTRPESDSVAFSNSSLVWPPCRIECGQVQPKIKLIFCSPTLLPCRFEQFDIFYSNPSAVCTESPVKINPAVLEKSPFKKNQILKMPILCGFYERTVGGLVIRPKVNNVVLRSSLAWSWI